MKSTIQDVLNHELEQRCIRNPSYSMRSFALSLNIPAGTLSQLMSGKRQPSKMNLQKICSHLGLSLEKTQAATYSTPQPQWATIEADVFAAISLWYHFAILELIKIHRGKVDEDLIARRLKISKPSASAALQRLRRLDMIVFFNGKYIDRNQGFASYYDGVNTSVAQRGLMLQMLQKSSEAVHNVDIAYRDHSSTTMSIHKKDLPKAKELLKNFRREFTALMEETKSANEVYELTMAFYPLTEER